MKICRNCGAEVQENFPYCPFCGTEFALSEMGTEDLAEESVRTSEREIPMDKVPSKKTPDVYDYERRPIAREQTDAPGQTTQKTSGFKEWQIHLPATALLFFAVLLCAQGIATHDSVSIGSAMGKIWESNAYVSNGFPLIVTAEIIYWPCYLILRWKHEADGKTSLLLRALYACSVAAYLISVLRMGGSLWGYLYLRQAAFRNSSAVGVLCFIATGVYLSLAWNLGKKAWRARHSE